MCKSGGAGAPAAPPSSAPMSIKNYLPPHSLKIDTVPLQRFSFKGFIGHKSGYILTPNDHYFLKKEQKKLRLSFSAKRTQLF